MQSATHNEFAVHPTVEFYPLVHVVQRVVEVFRRLQQRRRIVADKRAIDHRILRSIGLRRSDIDAVTRRGVLRWAR